MGVTRAGGFRQLQAVNAFCPEHGPLWDLQAAKVLDMEGVVGPSRTALKVLTAIPAGIQAHVPPRGPQGRGRSSPHLPAPPRHVGWPRASPQEVFTARASPASVPMVAIGSNRDRMMRLTRGVAPEGHVSPTPKEGGMGHFQCSPQSPNMADSRRTALPQRRFTSYI